MQLIDAHRGQVFALAFSPDGSLLASAGGDRFVQLSGTCTRQARAAFPPPCPPPVSLTFTPDGQTLAVGGANGVMLYHLESGKTARLPVARDFWLHVSVSPDGRFLAAGLRQPGLFGDHRRVMVWEVENRRCVADAEPRAGVESVALLPDDRTLAVGHSWQGMSLWDWRGNGPGRLI